MTIIACCCTDPINNTCCKGFPLPEWLYLTITADVTGADAGGVIAGGTRTDQPLQHISSASGFPFNPNSGVFEYVDHTPFRTTQFGCQEIWGVDGCPTTSPFQGYFTLDPERDTTDVAHPLSLVTLYPCIDGLADWAWSANLLSCSPMHFVWDVVYSSDTSSTRCPTHGFGYKKNILSGLQCSSVVVPSPGDWEITYHCEVTE